MPKSENNRDKGSPTGHPTPSDQGMTATGEHRLHIFEFTLLQA